jgi:catechol 2,3-dioxygenase-like lactoylglutathione lyase family enzyme
MTGRMAIELDHTIVPVADKWASARFFAGVFGVPVRGEMGPFVQVEVNDRLTLDFESEPNHTPHHYAFRVDEATFTAILERVRSLGISFGSGPEAGWDGELYVNGADRGTYFADPSGHMYEIITVADGAGIQR